MNRNASETAVDRLIALALDEPAKAGAQAAAAAAPAELEPMALLEDPSLLSLRELEHSPMWKTLLQFRAFLPLVSRLLEADSPTRAMTALSSRDAPECGRTAGVAAGNAAGGAGPHTAAEALRRIGDEGAGDERAACVRVFRS